MLSASAFMTDTITWRAFRFGQLLATGAASSLSEWYDRLAAVTAGEIRAAAEAVFQEKGRVVGWFVPEARGTYSATACRTVCVLPSRRSAVFGPSRTSSRTK